MVKLYKVIPFEKKFEISCIWIQVVSVPRDPISQIYYPIGTRIVMNKKKMPYIWKYHYLKFKTSVGVAYLYEDEIEVVNEKRKEKRQQVITGRKKDGDKRMKKRKKKS